MEFFRCDPGFSIESILVIVFVVVVVAAAADLRVWTSKAFLGFAAKWAAQEDNSS